MNQGLHARVFSFTFAGGILGDVIDAMKLFQVNIYIYMYMDVCNSLASS